MNLKTAAGPRKGMQLGKAKKANDFLDSLRAEGENIQVPRPSALPPPVLADLCQDYQRNLKSLIVD